MTVIFSLWLDVIFPLCVSVSKSLLLIRTPVITVYLQWARFNSTTSRKNLSPKTVPFRVCWEWELEHLMGLGGTQLSPAYNAHRLDMRTSVILHPHQHFVSSVFLTFVILAVCRPHGCSNVPIFFFPFWEKKALVSCKLVQSCYWEGQGHRCIPIVTNRRARLCHCLESKKVWLVQCKTFTTPWKMTLVWQMLWSLHTFLELRRNCESSRSPMRSMLAEADGFSFLKITPKRADWEILEK